LKREQRGKAFIETRRPGEILYLRTDKVVAPLSERRGKKERTQQKEETQVRKGRGKGLSQGRARTEPSPGGMSKGPVIACGYRETLRKERRCIKKNSNEVRKGGGNFREKEGLSRRDAQLGGNFPARRNH